MRLGREAQVMDEDALRWTVLNRGVRLLLVLALVTALSGCCCCVIPISSRERIPEAPRLRASGGEPSVHRPVDARPAMPLQR